MRFLLVNKYGRITGGADAQCIGMAQALTERGHEVRLLSTADAGNLWPLGSFIPLTVSAVDKASLSALAQARAALSSLWNRTAYRLTLDIIDDFDPDVLIAHKLYPQLSVSPLVAARRHRVPVIQIVHDYEFVSASPYDDTGRSWDHDEIALRFRGLNSTLFATKRAVHRPRIDRWVAVSRYVASRLATRGIRATVIPNFGPFASEGREYAERSGVAFAGRLSPEKGVEELLNVAALMPQTQFRIAGDGPDRARVEQTARQAPNIEYVGAISRDQVLEMFRSARVVVVPSMWQEPGALVTLDAMSTGTPLVVHDVGGIAEYVGDANAGIVVPRSPVAMAAACRALDGNEDMWRIHAANGLAAATEEHSQETYCSRLLQVVAEATSSERRGGER